MIKILNETETFIHYRAPDGHLRKRYKIKCSICKGMIHISAKELRENVKKLCKYCYRKNNAMKREYEQASFDCAYNDYYNRSKRKSMEWDITKEEFRVLTQQNCYYCGKSPSSGWKTKHTFNGLYRYNGLDRIDNSKGYTLDNVVPCCKSCNLSKRDTDVTDFLAMIERIYCLQQKEKILQKILDRQDSI